MIRLARRAAAARPSPLAPLVAWWRGDTGFPEAQRAGLSLSGPRPLARAFPGWFHRYQLAGIAPATRSEIRTPRQPATAA